MAPPHAVREARPSASAPRRRAAAPGVARAGRRCRRTAERARRAAPRARASQDGGRSGHLRRIEADRTAPCCDVAATTARSSASPLPALGALAAEPLYVLVDTAIVGHLGTPSSPRSRCPARCSRRSSSSATSSATARPPRSRACTAPARSAAPGARRAGAVARAGDRRGVAVLCVALAGPAVALLGGERRGPATSPSATRASPRSAARSRSSRSPARATCAGWATCGRRSSSSSPRNALNVVLEVLFVYGFDWGLDGSAGHRDRAGRDGRALRGRLLPPAAGAQPPARPRADAPARADGRRALRAPGALLGAFVMASAVLARIGEPSLAPTRSPSSCSSSSRSCSTRSPSPARSSSAARSGPATSPGAGGGAAHDAVGARRRRPVRGRAVAAATWCRTRSRRRGCARRARAALWPLFALMQPASRRSFRARRDPIGAGDTRYLARSMLSPRWRLRADRAAGARGGLGRRRRVAGPLALMLVRLSRSARASPAALDRRGRESTGAGAASAQPLDRRDRLVMTSTRA